MAVVRGRFLREKDSAGVPSARSCTPAYNCHLICVQAKGVGSTSTDGASRHVQSNSESARNPGNNSDKSSKSKKLDEAAERVLDYYLNPKPTDEASGKTQTAQLFMVSPDIDTETLLANASEDLLSISAIAADLADDVDGSRRSVILAISRMADGVHLLVERAMDRLEVQAAG
jgi:hypothetical protein